MGKLRRAYTAVSKFYSSGMMGYAKVLTNFSLTGGYTALTFQHYGNPIYHATGIVANIFGRALDIVSTVRSIKFANSPEYKESGLDCCNEAAWNIGTDYTFLKQSLVINETFHLIMSSFLPGWGVANALTGHFIWENNMSVLRKAQAKLEERIRPDEG